MHEMTIPRSIGLANVVTSSYIGLYNVRIRCSKQVQAEICSKSVETRKLCAHACSVEALQMALIRDPLRRKMTANSVMKSIFSLNDCSAILLQPVVLGSYCRRHAPFKEQQPGRWSKTVRYVHSMFVFDSIQLQFITSNAFWRKIQARKHDSFVCRSCENALLSRETKVRFEPFD